ncbi:MAG: hypothetical protein ACTHMY_17980 [Solirubrobacteraceae bacterium]
MDHQQNPAQPANCPSPRDDPDRVDRAILGLLLFDPGVPLWAVDELVREIGNPIAVDDSLHHLHRAGLIHRLDQGFVFATRAAASAAALV